MEKENNNIEDLFKQSFDNYEPEVKPSVWKNIRVGLKWGSLAFIINAFIQKIGVTTVIAVLASVVAIGVGSIAYFKWNKNNSETAIVTNAIDTTKTQVEESVTEEISTQQDNIENNTIQETSENITTASPTEDKTTTSNKPEIIESVASIVASAVSGTAPLIVELANNGTGKANKWIFNDGKTTSELNPTHIFETPGTYQIVLTSKDTKGKQDTDTLSVEVKGTAPVAKEFTPNGDGVTDVFVLQSKNIASMNAKIYDVAGLVVYKSEGTDTKWDGKDMQGKDAPDATYYYAVQAQGIDGKKYDVKGAVKLKR